MAPGTHGDGSRLGPKGRALRPVPGSLEKPALEAFRASLLLVRSSQFNKNGGAAAFKQALDHVALCAPEAHLAATAAL
eukprot:8401500-Heterocapsa_arctica.AAC.1